MDEEEQKKYAVCGWYSAPVWAAVRRGKVSRRRRSLARLGHLPAFARSSAWDCSRLLDALAVTPTPHPRSSSGSSPDCSAPSRDPALYHQTRKQSAVSYNNQKSARRRRKHCALAVVRRSPTFSPRRRPLPGGAGRPKFNQLEMVTTFTYRYSLVRIDARNFELSW